MGNFLNENSIFTKFSQQHRNVVIVAIKTNSVHRWHHALSVCLLYITSVLEVCDCAEMQVTLQMSTYLFIRHQSPANYPTQCTVLGDTLQSSA